MFVALCRFVGADMWVFFIFLILTHLSKKMRVCCPVRVCGFGHVGVFLFSILTHLSKKM